MIAAGGFALCSCKASPTVSLQSTGSKSGQAVTAGFQPASFAHPPPPYAPIATKPGARRRAMRAASITNVPDPHMGSARANKPPQTQQTRQRRKLKRGDWIATECKVRQRIKEQTKRSPTGHRLNKKWTKGRATIYAEIIDINHVHRTYSYDRVPPTRLL